MCPVPDVRQPREQARFGLAPVAPPRLRRVGPSSLDAAYVTEGDLRDNVHFAAGVSLCRAAGCIVTDLDGGPVDTGGSPATRAGLIAAAAEATHAAMLALMHE